VTLRRPTPLSRPLQLQGEGDRVVLLDGGDLLAEARPAALDLPVPSPPSYEQARALSALYVGHRAHYFPGCFTCGPGRAPGDGLRIFAGRERPEDPVAAPFVPDRVDQEILWAAMDCPGYFAGAPPDFPTALLGRMTAELTGPVAVGERCVVLGWALGTEGRKIFAGTALFGADGRLVGRARQTWIRI
jgi:hypothetical protein